MIPVILSGGTGTRLWPVSRPGFPKPFAPIVGEPLFHRTVRRLAPLGSPWVVATAETRHLTRRALDELGVPAEQALFEPEGRNTAPAVALLCRALAFTGHQEEIVGVFPADHLVGREGTFRAAVALAARCAGAGEVVTLGIRPSSASTGFGYIEVAEEVVAEETGPGSERLQARRAVGFREKPDRATAESFVARGDFLWNAGMFVFEAAVMADHLARLLPAVWEPMLGLAPDLSNLAEVYAALPSVSLDHGVMERLGRHVSIPCEIGFSDVGSWDEVARLREGTGAVYLEDSRGSFVFPHRERVYGLVGVEDLLIVDTADALLVARKGASQAVRELVEAMKRAGERAAFEHAFEERPWGGFQILREEDHFKSKVIRVDPGHQLSYQSHRHRQEHWVIVRGRPEVVLDDEVLRLEAGQAVHIPRGAKHRIRNPGDEPVEFVEVQLGTYFGEDDIERYEDDYDRA